MRKEDARFFRKLTTYSVQTALITVANFALRVIRISVYTRFLGPVNRGIFAMIFTIPRLISTFGSMGLEVGNSIIISREKGRLEKVAGNTLLFLIAMCLLLMPLTAWLFSQEQILKTGIREMQKYAAVAALIVPFLLVNKYGKAALVANEQIREVNALRIMVPALSLINFLVLWSLTGESLPSAVYGWAGAYIFSSLYIASRVAVATQFTLALSWSYLKKSLSLGSKGYLSTVADTLMKRIDYLLVGYFLGARQLGYYAVSVATVEIVLSIISSVSLPYLPLRMGMRDGTEGKVTPVVLRHVIFVAAAILLGLILSGKLVIAVLYGRNFGPAYTPLILLTPGVLARSIYNILKVDLWSYSLPGLVSIYSVVSMVANLALNLVLIPTVGIAGAAVSTSASCLLSSALMLRSYRKISGKHYSELLFIKGSEISFMVRYAFERVRRAECRKQQ